MLNSERFDVRACLIVVPDPGWLPRREMQNSSAESVLAEVEGAPFGQRRPGGCLSVSRCASSDERVDVERVARLMRERVSTGVSIASQVRATERSRPEVPSEPSSEAHADLERVRRYLLSEESARISRGL